MFRSLFIATLVAIGYAGAAAQNAAVAPGATVSSAESAGSQLLANRADGYMTDICTRWEDIANNSVSLLVQRGPEQLWQLRDAVFRMRRARRSCQLGLLLAACEDYEAIARGTPWLIGQQLKENFVCTLDTESGGIARNDSQGGR